MCIVLAAVISWCGGEERFAVGSGREEGAWQGGEEEQEGTFFGGKSETERKISEVTRNPRKPMCGDLISDTKQQKRKEEEGRKVGFSTAFVPSSTVLVERRKRREKSN